METEISSTAEEDGSATEGDVEMNEQQSSTRRDNPVPQNRPVSLDLNRESLPSTSRDPCGTPKELKIRFQEKLAEIDQGGFGVVPSSWQPADDTNEEDSPLLIPQDCAPIVEKPMIIAKSFEEEITNLLKSIEAKFPPRNDTENDMEGSNYPDLEGMPDVPDMLFQFDDRSVSIQEGGDFPNFNEVLNRLKDGEISLAIDEDEMETEESFERRLRLTKSSNNEEVGPSSSYSNNTTVPVSLPEEMDTADVSEDRPVSLSRMPSEMDEMILPSLDSEDNRVLAEIDKEIKELPMSLPPESLDDEESALPSIVSEDGVVLPVVPTLFDDDVSGLLGNINGEEGLSGTFYEEALLPDISEDNILPSTASDNEMVLPELNREDESLRPQGYNGNVTQSSRGTFELNTQRLFHDHGEHLRESLGVNRIEDALTVDDVEEVFSPRPETVDEEEGSVVPSGYESSNNSHEEFSKMNGKTSCENVDRENVLDADTEELLKHLGGLPEPGTVGPRGQRRYDYKSIVTWEEDQLREFKGHRNICEEEIPPWCLIEPRTRSPISKNICGFLNTGMGGMIYVGILNNGLVCGEPMTPYQQDHLLLSLRDTLQRYRPPVPFPLVKLEFVPVLPAWHRWPPKSSSSILGYGEEERLRPHKLRTSANCWCDRDAAARIKEGIDPRRFVVEITILPVDPDDPLLSHMKPSSGVPTRPTFQADDAQIYYRKHASTIKCSIRDIEERAKDEVLQHKMPQLMAAWKEYLTYKKLTDMVQEALIQHGDLRLAEKIQQLEKQADKCTYRLVQERHPLYQYQ